MNRTTFSKILMMVGVVLFILAFASCTYSYRDLSAHAGNMDAIAKGFTNWLFPIGTILILIGTILGWTSKKFDGKK
jgi:hypothetical protein